MMFVYPSFGVPQLGCISYDGKSQNWIFQDNELREVNGKLRELDNVLFYSSSDQLFCIIELVMEESKLTELDSFLYKAQQQSSSKAC